MKTLRLTMLALLTALSATAWAQGGTQPGGMQPGASPDEPQPRQSQRETQRSMQKERDTQATPAAKTRSDWSPSDTERALKQLHEINMTEIEAGKLAKERATSEGIRDFGDTLADQHEDVDADVKKLAEERGVKLDKSMKGEAATALQQLRDVRDAPFDRKFLEMMSSDHEQAINQVKTWRAQTSDDKLRALLDALLPKLEKHRDQARRLQQKQAR